MKLYFSPTSPYVRKVLLVAHETGVADQIELLAHDSNIFTGINPATPIGKVPSLELDSGMVLYDSTVICEYLNSLSDSVNLFPQGEQKWAVLVLHALAGGMIDAQHDRRINMAQPEGEGSPSWDARNTLCINKCLDEMEKQASEFGDEPNIGLIAVACALGFHDLRFADELWRNGRPNLSDWYERFSKRESMLQTEPPS
jgi:glutathione S-transferase